ncbi:MAG: hypothetical protein ACI861_002191 [Paracoccaceae bacterium]|jgi:hypothetical protein
MDNDGSENKANKGQKSAAAEARDARLKEALRANLHRRKGQSRARKDAAQNADTADTSGEK